MGQDHSLTDRNSANVGHTERTLSAVAGSLLLYYVTKKHKADALLLLGSGYLLYRAVSGHCPVSSLVHRKANNKAGRPSNINVKTSVIVNRPRPEVYAFWRSLENLPLFMKHLDNVDEIDAITSAWKVKMPGGMGDIRWEAQIVKDEPGSELSWHSIEGSSIENAGKVNFSDTPGGGTRIDVVISYRAPLGAIGERLSRLFTPLFSDMIEKDVRYFKHFMENTTIAGE